MAATSPRSLLLLGECPVALPIAGCRAGQGRAGQGGRDWPSPSGSYGLGPWLAPKTLQPAGKSFCTTGSQTPEGQIWPQECWASEPLPTLLHT